MAPFGDGIKQHTAACKQPVDAPAYSLITGEGRLHVLPTARCLLHTAYCLLPQAHR